VAAETPTDQWKVIQSRVHDAIEQYFPYEGRGKRLVLHNLAFDEKEAAHNDIRSQEQAKDLKKTWGVPIYAEVGLVDKVTGKEIDRSRIKLLTLPKPTNRYSYIVEGSEWQVDNMWRLRSGVYANEHANGKLSTEFNLAKPFAQENRLYVPFDPKTRQFKLKYGGSLHTSLYSVLKMMGVDDAEMKKTWGEDIYKANATPKAQENIIKFQQALAKRGVAAESSNYESAATALLKEFDKTRLLPEATQISLGKPIDRITGEALLLASKKILGVAKGEVPPDDRNSLMFKTLHGVDDFLFEKLTNYKTKKVINSKISNGIDRVEKVRDLVSGELFSKPIKEFFTSSTLSRNPEQINPLEMISNHRATTIIGDEGGIKNERAVLPSMKIINPSHFGFLDPIHTPESERTGINLNLPIGVKKQGNEATIQVYDLKEGKLVRVTPKELHTQNIVMPDHVYIDEHNKLRPLGPLVKMKDPLTHEIVEKPFKEGRYLIPTSHQLFDESSNLIPFLQCDQGNRAMMAAKQAVQAMSLHNRELPLVQVQSGGNSSWEKLTGIPWSHTTQIEGTVSEIKKNAENGHPEAIIIKDHSGKNHEIQIYNHFPLNDAKTMIHSTPIVKVGDAVKKGQVVADSNFTVNGHLTLGTNLRVAYLPYKGYNFDDGIVISETAAKKLTSEHMHRSSIEIDPEHDSISKKKFMAYASTAAKKLTNDQLDKLGEDGIIRVGEKVMPGDVLIAAVGKPDLSSDTARLVGRLGKQALSHRDKSRRWESDHPGEVVKIVRAPNGKAITVYVKSLEPAEIGDKIVGRHANKAIITRIIPDHEMPRIGSADGTPAEVIMNPSGVPSRINLGQLLETAAGKIAEKTGKPYMVNNFGGANIDYVQKVKADLKKNGIENFGYEAVYDPKTGQELNHEVLTGPQYILKLKHQVEKKLAVRNYGAGPGGDYSLDQSPKGTGAAHPGQAMGQLEFYSLLAHGARHNLREMATYKADSQIDEQMNPQSHVDFWDRVKTGMPLPAPKPTFAYRKFENLLKATGVNIHKEGNNLHLVPLTDKGVLAMSNGEIKDPGRLLRGKDAKELEKGLFDPKITGGLPDAVGKGLFWSHIKLAEPLPNPIFVGTPQHPGPAVVLTGLKFNEFEDIVKGKKDLNGLTGGKAINEALKKIDVQKELKAVTAELPNLRGAARDHANQKARYLTALVKVGLKPHEAYVNNVIPVLPPVFRPVAVMGDGNLRFDDINGFYKSLGLINNKLKTGIKELPDSENQELREQLYDVVKSLTGLGGTPVYDSNRKLKGILDIIKGDQPKEGYFQKRIMKRRQELSMRSTIIPEPAMHLDYVGLPKDAAMELYKPFVIREMKSLGYTPLQAMKEMKDGREVAWKSLQRAMDKRPVLLKRDPALHKFSIMAFKPRLVEGKAIQIHPLVTHGYNADFDGDSVDLDTPIPLRISGVTTELDGWELISTLDVGEGNYIVHPIKMEALTNNGWKPIKTISFHEVKDKKKYEVTLKNGFKFIVSEDHSLMVHGKEVKPAGITIGTELDSVSVPLPTEFAKDWSYDKGVIFGNFLGDGSAELRGETSGRISIACKPELERIYLEKLWRQEFNASIYDNPVGYFQITDGLLAQLFLESCGKYAEGKFVSSFLLNRSTEFLKGLLAGYILADGSVELTKSGSYLIRTWSNSKALRDGMSLVANMLGLPHSIRERITKGKTRYIISFGKEAIKLIDYRCQGKKGWLIEKARLDYQEDRKDDRSSQSERGFEIQSIEEVEYFDRMIDIEVDDPSHVFAIQGGVIVHNTMSAFVPLTDEAVRESYNMLPSNNLFSPTHGGIMYSPDQESLLGLHLLSKWGNKTDKSFNTYKEALLAKEKGVIKPTDVIKVGGHPTTLGRLIIAEKLPDEVKNSEEFTKLIKDPKFLIMKKSDDEHPERMGLGNFLDGLARTHPHAFSAVVDHLKNIGNQYAYEAGFSIGLKDLDVNKEMRDKIIHKADAEVAKIKALKLSKDDREEKVIDVYRDAEKQLNKVFKPYFEKTDNKIFTLVNSGAKGKWAQFRQMTIAPMLMQDGTGKTLSTPVKKSYAEGLDVGDYWTALHGARKGTLQRVEGTSEPGSLTKEIVNVVIPNLIVSSDCGTTQGISMDIHENDTHDRFLAASVKSNGKTLAESGALITPSLTSLFKKNKIDKVIVRSPLKCAHGKGLCGKCYGLDENGNLPEMGTNIGVIAGQALGEPATQLAMDSFHTGGVASSRGGGSVDKFTRLRQLLGMQKTLPGEATLATASGKIDKIEKDHATNGHNIWIGGVKHFAPAQRNVMFKSGETVKKGDSLTDGPINPHQLLPLTDIHRVQNYLTDELYNAIYKDERVKRRNIETVVRGLTNLTRIKDPGDSDHLHGDIALRTDIEEHNRNLTPGEAPIIHHPIIKGASQTAMDQHEDWMARLNFRYLQNTILEGAAKGWKTDLHGLNPIPAYAYGAEFGKGTHDKPHHY